MANNIPIYSIAKELNIDSNRIILACKTLGILAKGSTKRLNEEELKKVKTYFETGKNVSEEVVEINNKETSVQRKTSKLKKGNKTNYFPNRLIDKS